MSKVQFGKPWGSNKIYKTCKWEYQKYYNMAQWYFCRKHKHWRVKSIHG